MSDKKETKDSKETKDLRTDSKPRPSQPQSAETPTQQDTQPAPPTTDQAAIIVVLIQTGASRSGAEALFQQMTDQEKQLFSQSIAVEQGQYVIRDSAKYFEAFQSINDRLYKATPEQPDPGQSSGD